MAYDKKKKKSLPRAYDEDTEERTGGKAAEATERAAQRRKEWEAKTKESTERARALTKQMTGYNSQGKTFGTKAGTKEPAFGVEASRPQSTAKSGLDALSSATSFEEYARKRREQEKEQGMKSAAARLAERNAAVNRAALPEAQEIDYAKAAEGLRGESGYGWKRVGNQVVFATPNSPLPKPTAQNTATPAQAPGLYGIKPVDYARDMSAIDSYRNRDRETQTFLDKYFGGSIPNDEQFVGTYRELVKNGQLTEDEMMKFHASADMVQKAAEQKKAYDAAIGRLGEDAEKYATGRETDYYERYGDAFNAEELAGDEPIQYSGYGSKDGISLEEAKKYTNSPYAAQGRDRYGLQRWSQTTPQEREAYQMMLNLYGQDAADEYMKSLQGELNQRLAGATAQEAASYAQEHPVLASMRTVLNAPVQGAGMLEMGVEKLFGRDVDLYDPRLNLSRETEATRGTVAQNLGGVGGFLYNTGMSMVDNLANMAVYGGLGSIATTISMGAGSAASAFNSAVERGASENQAMGAAALSGIAEALFEKVSLDNVITLARGGGLKTVVGNIAKQSGIEASEELFTGIANEIGDRLIMGGLSNYELAMAEYMRNGMSEAEAKKQAAMDAAKEIGLGALGGALSGGLMGAGGQATAALTGANRTQQQVPAIQQPAMPSVPAMPSAPAMPAQIGTSAMNANTQRMLAEAARQRAEAEQASTDEREQLMKEYQPEEPSVEPEEPVQPAQEREDMPSPAQVEQQQAETAEPEQEEAQENKPEETASEGENGQMLKTQRTATVRGEDGEEKQVNVVGVMMDEGTPIMITRNEQGETDYTLASEMSFDTDETELLGYEGIERMDAKGLRNYLDNYDASKGTAKEYADAYNTVFKRASAGLDYQQAVMENETARAYMTEDARMSAYAAGLNAYNQTHETVQPAAVETTQATEAPAYAAMSAKEGGRGGRISRRYTQAAFGKLSKEGKQNAVAQMELLNAIASRTGRAITIVDSIVGKGGGHANALYNPETGEIRIALDATGGAYTYAAMHELTHAMKQEHAGEWNSFAGFVKETLKNNKQNWDELVQYQMDQFGYTREQAEEEVICNTAPAMLQDESNVLKLYKGNRKLFERVVDWVKGMLKDIKAAGKALSTRSKSWAQMDALAKDRKALQEMYDRMMAVMEKTAENVADNHVVKMSQQESHYDYSKPFAEQIDDWLDGNFPKGDTFLVSSTPDVLQKIGFSKLPMSYDQKHMRQVLGNPKNRDHDLGVDFMKALPEMIADPVAIVTAPKNDGSIMMVLAHQNKNANDRPVVGIVRVEKGGAYNKIYVDANKLETAHSRGDLDEIITAAVEQEKAGGVGVYYVAEKKSLHSVLEHGQSQVLDSLNRTGYMHSIHDTGSNVKAELMDQTESRQFKHWFGDSKVVNEDGSPKLMYRGGNEDIEIFDRRKSKASNLYGRGFYFTESEEHAKQYGGVNSYYLRIEHPLDASSGDKQINQSQMRNFLEAVAEDEDYGLENYGYGATVDSVLRSLRGKDDFAALQDINATAVGDFVAAIELFNEVNGTKYDGIITPTETVVFDSRQIKSATDNAGTFDPENPNVKFSMQDSEGNELSDEQQEYFEDSKVRDEEGNLLVMYHGTTAYGDINVFKPGKKGWMGPGIYLTNKKADAQHYADAMGPGNGKMYTLYANVENPLYVYESDPVPEIMRAIYGSDRAYNTRAAKQANSPSMLTGADIKKLRAKGYDGIIWKFYKSVEVSVFSPEQIKNVDNDSPTDAKDIRYSMRETDENVQDAMSAEEKAYAQVKGHRITAAEADKLAGEMLKLANSDYDRQKAASRLSRTIDYIERGEDVDWNQVDDELTSLAADVMSKSRTLDMEHEEMAKPIRDYLRTTRIRLTESQRAEAESLAGTYGAYRKNLFGRVRLTSTGGTPLDSLWSELTAMNPELFPADAAEGEMAVLLTNAVDALKPVYHSGMGMNMEESANWLAGKVHEAYLSLPTVKAAAKNAKTFGESIVALKNAMKRFEETSWTEYQSALREIRAARGAQKRTQQQEETEALRKKYVQWREKDTAQRKERELKRKYRARIERTAGTLANWIDKPTDAKHVPANVEDSVKAMLSTLDFSGKDTKAAATLTEKLDRMATEMERAQKGSQEGKEGALYFEVDQQMIDQIRLVAERIRGNTSYQQMEGRGVYDLNSMELKELSKWLDVVKHVLTNASKMRGSYLTSYGSVAEVQQASYTELRKKKPWTAKKWLTKQWEKYFGADMLDSFTFFERLGPTANAVFKGLRDGFDEVTQHLRTAEEFSQKIFEGLKLEELTGPNAKQHAVELSDGETVKMTKGEMMAIYVLSRREQARGHMYAEQNGEGIRLRSDENPDPHQLKAADEKKIADMLTEEEKRAAEGMQKFLSKECASWGNETSMKLLGYRKFGEEYYWPISTDERTKNSGKLEDNFDANINAIQNQGMTKATVEGAKNAIVIDDIFDSYTRHISNMAAYSAYAIPLSDFNKWYNNTAVRRSIAKVMGPKGEEYVKNLIMALNGSARAQSKTGVERALSTMNRNAKTASVGLNARVVIQQPTSIARAAMYISPKYLAEAAMHKAPSADIINKYCGIAAWKNWGFFETNVGPNLKEMLTGTTTGMAKLREKSMYFAAMMDQWTMNRLWVASELETRDMYPELKPKSEEYYQQVGKRMSEIVDRTQVVDSVFHRSQMMRSKSWMAQTLTNFMSEPTKTYNLLAGAIYDFAENRNSKPVQKRLARAFGVVTVTGVLTAAASAVVDAFRDDEDEKKWLEKYMAALGSNTIDNLNPLGMLPLVKDIWSIVQGYSNSNMAFQSVQKLVWGYEAFIKYAQGGGNQNWYGVLYKMAQAGSSISGIPVSNLMRDFNGVWQTVTGVSLTLKPEGQKKQRLSKMYDALNKGDKEKAKEIREYLRLKAGMTPKEIDTAIAEMLEADPKIKEAYEAKAARDFATMNRAINALTAKGFIRESVDKAITSYAEDQKPKTEKVKDPGEQLAVTLYSNEDVADAARILAGVKDGSVTESDVKAMISERVAGSDAEDPKDTVFGNIRSELKKDYLAADARDDIEAMARIGTVLKSLLETEPEDMAEWVKDQHGVDLRSAIDAGDSTAALKMVQKMRKNDGKTDSVIKRSLDKYKQLYIDAVNARDTRTANQIKTMLKSLGLKDKDGDSLYTDKHLADWLK